MARDWENVGYGRYEYGSGRDFASGYQADSYVVRDFGEYVEGNTVRRVGALPERREEEIPHRRETRYPEKKPAKMAGIGRGAFVFVSMVMVAISLSGFFYLSTQNSVAKQKAEIVSLQSDIAQMKEQNDEMYQSIVNSVNLADIYKVATKKLKMVQAGKNQIYTYSNKKSDMVKQYANIPGAD